MTAAAILQQAGFVPTVPTPPQTVGTPQSKAQSHVPTVPTVPTQNNKGATGTDVMRARLLALAGTMGIPARVVLALPIEELEATAEQFAMCDGYLDGNGDPLPHSLLMFYLRELAKG